MTSSDDEPTRLPEDFLRKPSDQPPAQPPIEPPPIEPPADATQAYGTQPFPQQDYGQQQAPYTQPTYGAPGAYPQQGYPAYGYGYPPAVAPKHPSATTALVLGIVGLVSFAVCGCVAVVSPFAWYLGAKAKREIDESGGQYGGRGEAQAGMICGIIGTVLLILMIVAIGIFVAIGIAGGFDDGSSTTTY
ncbi:DUF4190 domain-containing protein [Nocardioides speluncae]|uniref:DUF4190 domain-containing protein n=1 Tax=Nocardioides speluncae TaxID=2670337 RepID=UPI00197F167E|nr:DUF4190 domain-containing protein [Nocardioides speluncae]